MPPKHHPKKRSAARIMAVAQAKAQGIVTGIVLGVRTNLHTLAVIGLAILAALNYWNEHKDSSQIQEVWKHSQNWAHKSDLTNAVEQLKNGDNQ